MQIKYLLSYINFFLFYYYLDIISNGVLDDLRRKALEHVLRIHKYLEFGLYKEKKM